MQIISSELRLDNGTPTSIVGGEQMRSFITSVQDRADHRAEKERLRADRRARDRKKDKKDKKRTRSSSASDLSSSEISSSDDDSSSDEAPSKAYTPRSSSKRKKPPAQAALKKKTPSKASDSSCPAGICRAYWGGYKCPFGEKACRFKHKGPTFKKKR